MNKEELLMLTYGEYKPKDYPKTLHGQREIILHIDRDPVNPEDGHCAYLILDKVVWMTTHRGEHMDMDNAIKLCPDDARVFIAGLGLGLILLYLARARKAREVVVAEINSHVIRIIEPRLRWWFDEHYPDFNWRVVEGDAEVEAQKHGEFDWFFWDIWPVADFRMRASDKFMEISKPQLTENGVITTWHDLAKMRKGMKDGFDFKSYSDYTLIGNIHHDNLRIRRDKNPQKVWANEDDFREWSNSYESQDTGPGRERKFWEKRYEAGYISGRGDTEVKNLREELWKVIERELPEINHIIDVGCGDLRIWGDRDCEDYVGIDFAKEVLQRNKNVRRPHWTFICADAATYVPGYVRENVFCFNMIYHVMDIRRLERTLINLCRYSSKKIFICTWIVNPFHPFNSDGKYQRYHPMGRYTELFNKQGFDLISVEIVEDPVKLAQGRVRSALYIYERKEMPLERFPQNR